MKFWNRHDRPLERDLASLRAAPSEEFAGRILSRLTRGQLTTRSSRMKVGVAMSLTALGLIVFAVFGGLGYASSAASKAAKVVNVVKVSSSASSVKVSASSKSTKSVKVVASSKTSSTTWICKWNGTGQAYTRMSVNTSSLATYTAQSGNIVPAPSDGTCPEPDVENASGKTQICKWNSSTSAYTQLEVANSALATYRAQSGNIIPAPDDGCPAPATGRSGGTIKICQWKGYDQPYSEKSIDESDVDKYSAVPGNLVPKPNGGCPSPGTGNGGAPAGKTWICHATGSVTNPFTQNSVADSALATHRTHPGDIIPAPAGGCPKPGAGNDNTTKICHWDNHSAADPYTELEIKDSEMAAHSRDTGDIIPKPAGGCPKPGTGDSGKTTICHWTSSASNPYVEITVSNSSLAAHLSHGGDIIPAPKKGCPKPDGGGDDHGGGGGGDGGGDCSGGSGGGGDSSSDDRSGGSHGDNKSGGGGSDGNSGGGGGAGGSQYGGCVPICHKTSSSSHPYTLILVPTSALPAHAGHGDIIPAPAAGCPGGSGDGDGGQKCNSGRGNGSEGDNSQLIQPGTGSTGTSPTKDCDPGNSGSHNAGGD